MPVHFNELKGIENANDGKINLTNLRADHKKKNLPVHWTLQVAQGGKQNARLFTLSLLPRLHTFAHTLTTRLQLLLHLQKCKCAAHLDETIHKTRTRRRVLVFPRTKQSKVWGVEPKAVNTSLRFLIWYTTPVQYRRRHVDKTRKRSLFCELTQRKQRLGRLILTSNGLRSLEST